MKILKIIGFVVMGLVLLLGAAVAWHFSQLPEPSPPSTEKVEATPERVARGKYLVDHAANCAFCHSSKDWTRQNYPVKQGGYLAGGYCFTEAEGLPGRICPSNLTSDEKTGLGAWTDGEIIRAIREGVSRDGRVLFPVMPFSAFAQMSDEDVRSIVAYLRTVPAAPTATSTTEIHWLNRLMMLEWVSPVPGPVAGPDRADKAAYGNYLAQIGMCHNCHTPDGHSSPPDKLPPNEPLAGGNYISGPWGTVVTANISPHPKTGIGHMDRETFIRRFKLMGEVPTDAPATPHTRSAMPWIHLAGMTEEDLGLIYDHLRSAKPVDHLVITRP